MNIEKKSILIACVILAEVMFIAFSTSGVYADAAPDFGMTISQSCATSQTCFILEPRQIGLTATYTIQYVPFSGFMDTITETVSGVPAAFFSRGTFFLSLPMTDTLSLDNLAAGTVYTLTVTAVSSNGVSRSVTTTLTTPKASSSDSGSNGMTGSGNVPIPDFNMVITPATQVSGVGVSSASYYISYTSINGFTGPINEKVANLPPQFVSFFSQQYSSTPSISYAPSYGRCYVRLNIPKSCTDVLTIYFTIGNNAQALGSRQTYSLIVTANAEGNLPSHSVTIPLTVP